MVVDGSFREDLDVSGIAAQYSILREFAVPGEGFHPDDLIEEYERATEEPRQYGNGPMVASSCVALVPIYPPQVCHDVNGYYRSLSVHFRASKRELREAYQACDGPGDQYLTFVLKQLLDPVVRREYDLMPLGSVYMNDPFVQDAIKIAAYREAARRRKDGHDSSAEAVLSEWGFNLLEDELETVEEIREVPVLDEELSEDEDILYSWAYSYYLWRSAPCEDDRLKEWQQLIVSALARRGLIARFTVGFMGGDFPDDILYMHIEDHHVLFLNANYTPHTHLADIAADLLEGTQIWQNSLLDSVY
jgi:hypothetical protein